MTANGDDDSPPEEVFTYEVDADESMSQAVIVAVAAVSGQSITELKPLYETVDPEALNRLFRVKQNGQGLNGCVSFPYNGYVVSIDGERQVVLTEK